MTLEITTKVIDRNPRHTKIAIWQNGGRCGELVVETEHADEVIARLDGSAQVEAARAWKQAALDTLGKLQEATDQVALAVDAQEERDAEVRRED